MRQAALRCSGRLWLQNHTAAITLDNGQVFTSALGSGGGDGGVQELVWNGTNGTTMRWLRQNETEVVSSISLAACEGNAAAQLSNLDGQ